MDNCTPDRCQTIDRLTRGTRKGKWFPSKFYFNYAREFFLYTSTHGYKYIAQPKGTVIERVFWTLVVLTAIVSAVFIMGIEWNFHLSRYTITSVDTAHYPLWNIPFPAVTVCGFNKVQRTQAQELINELQLPFDVTEDDIFEDMKYLLELLEPSARNETNFRRLQSILDNNNISLETVMKRVAPQCETLLARCSWKGRVQDSCSKLFRLHKTYEGYCCSFNYVGIREEILKKKVKDDHDIPRKTTTTGYRMGLKAIVRTRPKQYHATNMASFGVKVLIHDPYDYPDVNTPKKIVTIGSHVFFSIPPWVTFSTPEVRNVPIHNRGLKGCLFPDEKVLKKMKNYSYNNCITECRENYTIELCGCTPFYYPNNGGYRMCNLTDVPCLAKNKRKLEIMNPGQEDFEGNKETPIEYPCNCLPDCANYYYPIESSEGVLSVHSVDNEEFIRGAQLNLEHDSAFNIYFGNFMVTRYRRDVLYSWKSLLASLGGLLSLFIGFSFIGGIELFYYFTIRLYYKMRHWKDLRQKESSNISTLLNARWNNDPDLHPPVLVNSINWFRHGNWRGNNLQIFPDSRV